MKIRFLIIGAFLALPAALSAQNTISYFLPATHLSIEVEAVRESFFAGPYAPYAKKLLGIDVKQENSVRTYVSSVTLEPTVEADPSAHYTAVSNQAVQAALVLSSQGLVSFGQGTGSDGLRWTFPGGETADFSRKGVTSAVRTEKKVTYKTVQTDTSVNRVPVTQDVTVVKTPEQRAKEAADLILRARTERFNITIGNTDATYSGEALGSAIAELARMEEEYMTLFVGSTVREIQTASFEIQPASPDKTCPVFRLSPEAGLTSAEGTAGTLYYLTFKTEKVAAPVAGDDAAKAGKAVGVIQYRIPAVSETELTNGRETLVRTRIPVYQFGTVSSYPVFK